MKYDLQVPDTAFEVLEGGLMTEDYLFDYLCAVSSCVGIPPTQLYVARRRVYFRDEPLLVDRSSSLAVLTVWQYLWDARFEKRAIGVGYYADFFMDKVGLSHGAVLGTNDAILVMKVPVGRTVNSFREQVALGERSLRQSGIVELLDDSLVAYWQDYREVEVRGSLMYIKHISRSDLVSSRERLQAGLTPRRRYNTPGMRRRPGSNQDITTRQRVEYKWMAYELLSGLHGILNYPSPSQEEIDVDNRGVLHLPVLSPQVESGFTSLWLKVDDRWDRIRDVRPLGVPESAYTERGLIEGTEGVTDEDGRLPNGLVLERIVTGISWQASGRQYSETIESEVAILSPKTVAITIDSIPYQVIVAD